MGVEKEGRKYADLEHLKGINGSLRVKNRDHVLNSSLSFVNFHILLGSHNVNVIANKLNYRALSDKVPKECIRVDQGQQGSAKVLDFVLFVDDWDTVNALRKYFHHRQKGLIRLHGMERAFLGDGIF